LAHRPFSNRGNRVAASANKKAVDASQHVNLFLERHLAKQRLDAALNCGQSDWVAEPGLRKCE